MPPDAVIRRLPLAVCLSLVGWTTLPAEVDFAHEVVPILRKYCSECHTGDKKKGGFSMNTRTVLLEGGEDGVTVVPGHADKSKLIEFILSKDLEVRMPPKGDALTPAETETLRTWIGQGAVWTEGFAFKQPAFEPTLRPRQPTIPPAIAGHEHPIDRILEGWLQTKKSPTPPLADDATFLRRAHLDFIGLLPTVAETQAFVADPAPDKRVRLIRSLLGREIDYADHWMVFWNDLLRNDYAGTGYIDGGRKQITPWLYAALRKNMPYDEFVRELIAPTAASEGFTKGIIWRGAVSVAQAPELQFAQSVSQVFLGINMKCASCHDSFIDRWKLKDAYGLAAIYSDHPMELVRCDIPTGKSASAAWPFPELGQVDANKPRAERLVQLAALLTQPDNARFQRTMVNRLWHRLMGRGIVHPVDAMQTEPWNQDLLDVLANHFVAQKYDLKATLEFIATSRAYQSQAEVQLRDVEGKEYFYRGPRGKRLTAEQFVDLVWRVTGTTPFKIDAGVQRMPTKPAAAPEVKVAPLLAQPIWSNDVTAQRLPAAGEARTFRRSFTIAGEVEHALLVATADNSFEILVNGKTLAKGENWAVPQLLDLAPFLKLGRNQIIMVGRNGGTGPNVAAVWCQVALRLRNNKNEVTFGSDATWEWSAALPNAKGVMPVKAAWLPVAKVPVEAAPWKKAEKMMAQMISGVPSSEGLLPRASLVKSDLLQRSLGRPNREQIVSSRPTELSTLEAIDLSNGTALTSLLDRGAISLLRRPWKSSEELARWLYLSTLCRPPSAAELKVALELLGAQPTDHSTADLLWAIFMLPEFQTIR